MNTTVGVQMLGRYDTALQRLREADRELVVARVELGLDYEEIAGLLDKPSIPAARVAVSRALVRLAAEMGVDRHA
jgi:DNA-directed RNA polymerase specialized sigma24 family protein